MLRQLLTLGACLLAVAFIHAPASAQPGPRTTPRFVPKLEPVLAKPFTQLFLNARTGG